MSKKNKHRKYILYTNLKLNSLKYKISNIKKNHKAIER